MCRAAAAAARLSRGGHDKEAGGGGGSVRAADSLDKQYVRDYLLSIHFDKKTGVVLPDDVIANTLAKYQEVYRILTGKEPVL